MFWKNIPVILPKPPLGSVTGVPVTGGSSVGAGSSSPEVGSGSSSWVFVVFGGT